MKTLNVYQKLQLWMVLLIVAMFCCYVILDLFHYELSEFASGTRVAIWSIILLLIDPKGLAAIIHSSTEQEDRLKNDDALTTTEG